MQIEAGELNVKASFQKRSKAKNAIKEVIDSWSDIGAFLVKYSTLSQKSMAIAKGFSASVEHGILMRYVGEINNDCRVIVMGKTIQIAGVIHDPHKQWTQVFLSENQN